jgi:RsiW-degrading membrane proteinase PrsW (M82 family)
MFFKYLFFWLTQYYQKERNLTRQKIYAYVTLGFLLMLNLVAVVLFMSLFSGINLLNKLLTDNKPLNRFIIIPMICAPVFILLWYYYKNNQNSIDLMYREYIKMTDNGRKNIDNKVKAYIIGTIILLFMAIISPLII